MAEKNPEHASWAFLFITELSKKKAYPVKFVGNGMYSTATLDPTPSLCGDAGTMTAHIDELVQDGAADVIVVAKTLKFLHFNPKTLKKVRKIDCFVKQLKRDICMATFPESRSNDTGV